MDWISLIDIAFNSLLVPLLIWAFTALNTYIKGKTQNERIKRILQQATDAANKAVSTIAQTFVDNLKASGEWSKENAETAALMALELAKSILGAEGYALLVTAVGEAEEYLKAAIEDAVRKDKQLQ